MSVIIPALNVAHVLPRQLAALALQTFQGKWEVLVADNGSVDGTAEAALCAEARPAELRVVSAAHQRGISHARNVGARAARGRFLLFCDADDVVAPGWVEEMAKALLSFDMVGGCLDYDRLNDDHSKAWRPRLAERALPEALGFLPFAVGANFGVRADAYGDLGGCDERFRVCCDDVDLSWRMQLTSHTIGFAPDAVVHYQLRSDLRALARQQFIYGRTEALLVRKFRLAGIARPPLVPTLRVWWYLASRWFHVLRGPVLKGIWFREACYRAGRLVGAMRYRVLHW